uniref:pyruvate kinase n=2 Tax=Kalanchoe fedtschenkoi TaxID=63787 RepID=A0A7N0TFA4_KALFE
MFTSQQTVRSHVLQPLNLLDCQHYGLSLRKVTLLPCRIFTGKSGYHPLFLAENRSLNSHQIVCGVSKKNDGPESISSRVCADNLQSNHLNNSEKYINDDVEVVASISSSEPEFPQSFERLANQGRLLDKLEAVYLHILAAEQWNAMLLEQCYRQYSASATNLIHYLALKCLDIERLKEDLSASGLDSLEKSHAHVLASLAAVIQMLKQVDSDGMSEKVRTCPGSTTKLFIDKQRMEGLAVSIMKRKASLNHELLLGPSEDGRTHIMVTVGQEAAESEDLISNLLKRGTTIFRINCAHGNHSIWSEIIGRAKRSSQMLEKPCRILMDLAGPKLRTGKLRGGPCVIKVSPKKDAYGSVTYPAQIWLSPKGSGPPPNHLAPDVTLCIEGQEFLTKLRIGDTVKFKDARGKKIVLKISKRLHVFSGTGFIAECSSTAYIQSGTKLHIKNDKNKLSIGQVIAIPPVERFVRLRVGDLLTLYRNSSEEEDEPNSEYNDAHMHRMPCSSGWLFDSVKLGDPIAFDDGKIWGVIKGTSMTEVVVSITHAGQNGTKLGSDKSINIPESDIHFQGLTSKDLMDLDFVAAHADMAGVSFVRDTSDIVVLQQELSKRNYKNLGIVLKIETKSGFEKLPLMLLEAMKSPNPLGVMIARGDLAVECGWERLADMQDEIISICYAAHVPVIWATQVLESLLKSGVPSRAEISDVACARRANCVMLNKGKHVLEGVTTLDTLLQCKLTNPKENFKPIIFPG